MRNDFLMYAINTCEEMGWAWKREAVQEWNEMGEKEWKEHLSERICFSCVRWRKFPPNSKTANVFNLLSAIVPGSLSLALDNRPKKKTLSTQCIHNFNCDANILNVLLNILFGWNLWNAANVLFGFQHDCWCLSMALLQHTIHTHTHPFTRSPTHT